MSRLGFWILLVLAPACQRSTAEWIEDLGGTDPFERELAALALRDAADDSLEQVLEALIEAGQDPEESVRYTARATLQQLAPRMLDLLIRRIAEGQPKERAMCLQLLSEVGPAVAPRLVQLLRAQRHPGRIQAVDVLANIGSPALPWVLPLLRGGDAGSRSLAAQTLGRIGPAALESLPALRQLIGTDSDPEVRQAAIDATLKIAPFPDEETWQVLNAAMQDSDRQVQLVALRESLVRWVGRLASGQPSQVQRAARELQALQEAMARQVEDLR
jgi:hypothetical protein